MSVGVLLLGCAGTSSDGDGEGTTTTQTGTGEAGTASSEDGSSGPTGSTGADGSSSSTGADGSSESTGEQGPCFAPELLEVLQAHVTDLAASASMLATHPGPLEATGFLLAPALPAPPAQLALFAGPLLMACDGPSEYVEYCSAGACIQVECTGRGTSWIMHVRLEDEHVSDAWTHGSAEVDVGWTEGETGVTFTIAAAITGPDEVDLSFEGTGTMDLMSMSVSETYANLHPAGPAVLSFSDDARGHAGALVIAEVQVAVVDPAGELTWTGECPR